MLPLDLVKPLLQCSDIRVPSSRSWWSRRACWTHRALVTGRTRRTNKPWIVSHLFDYRCGNRPGVDGRRWIARVWNCLNFCVRLAWWHRHLSSIAILGWFCVSLILLWHDRWWSVLSSWHRTGTGTLWSRRARLGDYRGSALSWFQTCSPTSPNVG